MKRTASFWLAAAAVGYYLLPWYLTDDGIFSLTWALDLADGTDAPGLAHAVSGRLWLLPIVIGFVALSALIWVQQPPVKQARRVTTTAAVTLVYIALQGLMIQRNGPRALT